MMVHYLRLLGFVSMAVAVALLLGVLAAPVAAAPPAGPQSGPAAAPETTASTEAAGPTTGPAEPPARKRGLFRNLADGARRLGRKAGDALGEVAGDVADGARDLGRKAERGTRRFIKRLSHRSTDLTSNTTAPDLSLVIPGTDLGVRVLSQVDKWGHYDPAWAHNPQFVEAVGRRWPGSQVKLFTWLSGPDPITIDSAANGLYHYLSAWRQQHPGRKVRIYAHSNGGNVALHAASRYQPTTGQSPLFIDELVTAGTPLKYGDQGSARFGTVGRIVFVFTRHDWVAGHVQGTTEKVGDPRAGVVPKLLDASYTPELVVLAHRSRRAGPIQSPAPNQYVVPIDASTATTRTVDVELAELYGPDFLQRRANGSIGEVDASAIVMGHSDYNRPDVAVAILDLVGRYDRGLVPDAATASRAAEVATTAVTR